jgi:hypothetical protein
MVCEECSSSGTKHQHLSCCQASKRRRTEALYMKRGVPSCWQQRKLLDPSAHVGIEHPNAPESQMCLQIDFDLALNMKTNKRRVNVLVASSFDKDTRLWSGEIRSSSLALRSMTGGGACPSSLERCLTSKRRIQRNTRCLALSSYAYYTINSSAATYHHGHLHGINTGFSQFSLPLIYRLQTPTRVLSRYLQARPE